MYNNNSKKAIIKIKIYITFALLHSQVYKNTQKHRSQLGGSVGFTCGVC